MSNEQWYVKKSTVSGRAGKESWEYGFMEEQTRTALDQKPEARLQVCQQQVRLILEKEEE